MPQDKTNDILAEMAHDSQISQQELIDGAKARLKAAIDTVDVRESAKRREYIRMKTAEIAQNEGERISVIASRCRADLFHHREEIRRKVFERASQRIEEFTQTEQYRVLLCNSADQISSRMGGKCSVLFIREKDRPYAAEICGHLGASITMHIDKNIKHGGIRVQSSDGSLMIDDTLDARLKDQEKWFMENSGLVID